MSQQTFTFFLVFVGGGIGSMLRHGVNQISVALWGANFPFGTLGVNIIGSLAMGLLAGWFAFRGDGGQTLRLFLATGLLGGFTTFSAFSLEATLLWERGQTFGAVFYVLASVLTALICVSVGLAIIRTTLAS